MRSMRSDDCSHHALQTVCRAPPRREPAPYFVARAALCVCLCLCVFVCVLSSSSRCLVCRRARLCVPCWHPSGVSIYNMPRAAGPMCAQDRRTNEMARAPHTSSQRTVGKRKESRDAVRCLSGNEMERTRTVLLYLARVSWTKSVGWPSPGVFSGSVARDLSRTPGRAVVTKGPTP